MNFGAPFNPLGITYKDKVPVGASTFTHAPVSFIKKKKQKNNLTRITTLSYFSLSECGQKVLNSCHSSIMRPRLYLGKHKVQTPRAQEAGQSSSLQPSITETTKRKEGYFTEEGKEGVATLRNELDYELDKDLKGKLTTRRMREDLSKCLKNEHNKALVLGVRKLSNLS